MSIPEFSDTKLYYSIGEVAEKMGVNASLIRFWEKEFGLQPSKSKKGNRLFTSKDIAELELIYHLVKERGFTLDGARQKMRSDREGTEREKEVVERLTKVRSFLLELKAGLDRTGGS
ncbi:MAG: MerR family transcriptional regulator [Cryomorphaceae bacterium]|nr:MAG: MerR family transcriptional regulator [Cryomorphaceae bacterium]